MPLRQLLHAITDRGPGPASDEVRDDGSAATGAQATDSERLLVENRKLRYEQRRWRTAIDRIPDGLMLIGPGGNLLHANPAAAALLGVDGEQIRNRPLRELSSDLATFLDGPGQTAIIRQDSGDDTRHIAVQRALTESADGSPDGAVLTLRDTTQIEATERAQVEFLSQIAHELKAPLNTIVAYVEALTDGDLLDADERRDYANSLTGEAMRMAQLISNLLQMSRIQLGNLSARFHFVKPKSVMTEVAESFRAQAERGKRTLEVDIPDTLPPLFGDRDLLGVAISNLVSNALKYTPEGGWVRLRAGEARGGVELEVSDSGIGIPLHEQARIFERFTRSEQDEVQSRPGTGLGLSLVREIVRLHGGDVTVESEPGRGSRFLLWMPCREVSSQIDLAPA